MTTVFGIKQCDTVKKACRWLDQHSVPFTFHDFRIDGLTSEHVANWLASLGAETLINKRSTTFRQLDEQSKAQLEIDPVTVLLAHPTLIKRPVLEHTNAVSVGFSDAQFAQIFTRT